MKTLQKAPTLVAAAVLCSAIGLFARPATANDCDESCPFDTIGVLTDCEPVLDGTNCHYSDQHYYFASGGDCDP